MNSTATSAESKNVWSPTSTPWWINYVDPTSSLNRTLFCVIVPCGSKMSRRCGGTYHIHSEGSIVLLGTCLFCAAMKIEVTFFPQDTEEGKNFGKR
jgi:hypothetical protein